MTIFNRALFVINEVYDDEYVRQHMTPLKVTQALDDADLLAPDPQIIRTRDELAALDPDSLILDCTGHLMTNLDRLPAVVVATGEQVRAARQALEEA